MNINLQLLINNINALYESNKLDKKEYDFILNKLDDINSDINYLLDKIRNPRTDKQETIHYRIKKLEKVLSSNFIKKIEESKFDLSSYDETLTMFENRIDKLEKELNLVMITYDTLIENIQKRIKKLEK